MSLCLQLLAAMAVGQLQAGYRAWDAVVSAKLDAQLAAIRAAGEPVGLADLAKLYAEPPPGENGAPLYKAAFLKIEGSWEALDALTEPLPIVGVMPRLPAERPLDEALVLDIERYLRANREVFDLLDQATDRKDCWFELAEVPGAGLQVVSENDFRHPARLYCLLALRHTERGEADRAAAALHRGLKVAMAIGRVPTALSARVHLGTRTLIVMRVEDAVNRMSLRPETLTALQQELHRTAIRDVVVHTLLAERCQMLDLYRLSLDMWNPLELLAHLDFVLWAFQWTPDVLTGFCPPAYIKGCMSAYVERANECVAIARRPHPRSLVDGVRLSATLEERVPNHMAVVRPHMSDLRDVFTSVQRSRAKCDAARAALACLRYQAEKGKLPGTLGALVPEYIDAVPVDPYDAKPLRYRKIKDGFVIYAIGQNGKDDGGDTVAVWEEGDVGFRVARPKTRF